MSITALPTQHVPAGTRPFIADLDNAELQDRIRSVSSNMTAAMCHLLLLVAELDRRGAWADWGIQSCAHWLSWQCGFSIGAAREHVRVARKLSSLPRTVALFESGEISYAKVRAITRVATEENEALLVEYAKEHTAVQLERIVRTFRRVTELNEANDAHEARSLQWINKGDGKYALVIEMTAEQKPVVEAAIAKCEKGVPAGTSPLNRKVDAVVLMAQAALEAKLPGAKKPHVVNLVVAAETLADDADGECNIDGVDICPETARRLSCDAPVVVSLVDDDGVVLKQGRKSRLFTGATRAAVLRRDKGCCVYPGCTHTKWIDVHHIQHWSRGGLTDPENGATLCGFHHRLVHEGGFSLDHTLTFRSPNGIPIPAKLSLFAAEDPSCTMPRVRKNACVSSGNGGTFSMDYRIAGLLNASSA
jgi:hypothetical protein